MGLIFVPLNAQNKKALKKEVIASVETQKDELITVSKIGRAHV